MSEPRGWLWSAIALWLQAVARLLPTRRRPDWLREWRAELDEAARSGRSVLGLAVGAPADAMAVRRSHRPGSGTRRRGGFAGGWTELKRAIRSLLRTPGFTMASVVTLSAGLGATVAIFTLVDGILLRPLPYPEPSRLVRVEHTMGESGGTNSLARFAFALFAGENRSFELFGGYWAPELYTLAGDAAAERVTGAEATADLMRVLGASAVAGRLFTEAEGLEGGDAGVLVSERLWRRRYGGDPAIVGRIIRIDGEPRQVLGVVADGVDLPDRRIDLWIPYAVPPGVRVDDAFRINVIARLAPGASVEAAQADMDRLTLRLPEIGDFYSIYLDELGLRTRVRPLRDEVVGDMARALWILLGAVGIVLLIAAANVATLFLVRAEGRRAEVAVRSALGAGRARLVGAFLSETMVVAITAGLIGLVLAWVGVRLVVVMAPPEIPRLDEIRVRGVSVAVGTSLSLLCAIVLAFYPVVRFTGRGPAGVRGPAGGQDRSTMRAGSALVVIQVALALVLLSGSSLLFQTFRHLRAVDPGFVASGVLVTELSVPEVSYPSDAQVGAFFANVLSRVQAIPGVRRAALGPSPLRPGGCSGVYVEGVVLREDEFPPCVPAVMVGPGYFDVLGIPVAGRKIEESDLEGPPVAIVSENAARRLWPDRDPLTGGLHPAPRRGPPWFPVVGTAASVHGQGPDRPATEVIYLPISARGEESWSERSTGLLVATQPDMEGTVVPALRRAVADLDADIPITISGTLAEELARATVRQTFTLVLLAIAAVTALVLGLVGLYGVIAYRVETRRPEIGIRMAIGARGPQVRQMILRHSLRLVVAGTVFGLVAAAILTRALSSLLFGIRPGDPLTLGVAALALAGCATAASWIPARRASRVDPATALRSD